MASYGRFLRHSPDLPVYQLQNSFVGVARGNEGCQKFLDVRGASRLHGDIDGGVAEIDAVVGAVIGSLDDVSAVVGQNSGEAMQSAGIIGQMHAQADEATVFYQAAFDDARE